MNTNERHTHGVNDDDDDDDDDDDYDEDMYNNGYLDNLSMNKIHLTCTLFSP